MKLLNTKLRHKPREALHSNQQCQQHSISSIHHKWHNPKQICQLVLQLKHIAEKSREKLKQLLPTQRQKQSQRKCKVIKQIITSCYGNSTNQLYLCNNLHMPYTQGPISITQVPQSFQNRTSQLISLFQYLTKIKQSYMCWIIYQDAQLGILNIKLITQYEFEQLSDRLQMQSGEIIVGLFVGKIYFPKMRTFSTQSNADKQKIQQFQNCLSNKTTQQSLLYAKTTKTNKISSGSLHANVHGKHNTKIVKSVSMKENRLFQKRQLNTSSNNLVSTQGSTIAYKNTNNSMQNNWVKKQGRAQSQQNKNKLKNKVGYKIKKCCQMTDTDAHYNNKLGTDEQKISSPTQNSQANQKLPNRELVVRNVKKNKNRSYKSKIG